MVLWRWPRNWLQAMDESATSRRPVAELRGAPAAQRTVGAARCDWIAVLNSDNAAAPGRFEAMVNDPLFPRSEFVFGNLPVHG